MPLSRRHTPEHPPDEDCLFGMDYSFVIPVGVGIAYGTLQIFTNTAVPALADADWSMGPVEVRDRTVYARLSGGRAGVDYQLRWVAHDTEGNAWPRTALVLCALTS